MSREDENDTYGHDEILNLSLNHNAIELAMDLPFDPSEDLKFSNTMTKPLYSMLLKFLIIVETLLFHARLQIKNGTKNKRKHGKCLFAKTLSTFSIIKTANDLFLS